jgi:hypothetical protein
MRRSADPVLPVPLNAEPHTLGRQCASPLAGTAPAPRQAVRQPLGRHRASRYIRQAPPMSAPVTLR